MASHPEIAIDPAGPTRIRHQVVAVTGLAAVLLYLDRLCPAILGAYIPEELGLSLGRWAWVLGAFFWTYALAQVPAGRLADRLGPRRVLAGSILAWSACTAAMGLAAGFAGLLLARLACGLAQAGAYPAAAVLLRRWVPLSGRGRANSLVTLGGRLGAVLAPPLTAALVVAFAPRGGHDGLAPGDLLDAPRLGRQLTGPGEGPSSPLRLEVLRRLSGRERDAAHRLAGDGAPSPDDAEAVRAGLDRLLGDTTLTEAMPGSGPTLPGEAEAILAVAPGRRSPAQVARLNRLALEAAFPGSIRQIYGRGWRPVLVFYGAAGLIAAVLFWVVVRDGPRAHPRCNADEIDPAVGGGEPDRDRAPGDGWAVLRLLVASRNLWLCSLMQFCINVGWAFLVTLMPTYLAETFGTPIERRGRMMAAPILAGCVGMFAGGVLTDRLARSIGLRRGRAVPIALAGFAGAAALLACPRLPGAWSVVAALAVMATLVDLGVPSIWAFVQDVGGRDSGAALGWGNMWGNLGAALSPVVLARVRESGGWDGVFVACAASFLVAGLAALGLDATRPLREPARPAAGVEDGG